MKARTKVGIGWEKEFPNGAKVLNLSLSLETLVSLPMDKYGCVYVEVQEATNPGTNSKETHAVYVDDYKREKLKVESAH